MPTGSIDILTLVSDRRHPPIIQLVIVCLVVLLRTTERAPALVAGEGVAPTAGIVFSGIGHVVKYKTC